MGRKRESKINLTEIVTLKVRGAVTEPRSWAARHFAIFALHKATNRYSLDVQFLFEMEWIYLRRSLLAEGVEVPKIGEPSCAVWANDKYVGDDVGLCQYLKSDGYISTDAIYAALNLTVRISSDPMGYCPRNLNRSYVYMDVEVDGKNVGRMLFELFTDVMPNSCERFLKECKRYNGCPVHRIARDGWFESGQFDEEDIPIREKRSPGLSNCREGMLSLVNTGKSNCKSSQFLITVVPAPFLDPYQCPIGTLLDGVNVLVAVNNVKTHYDSPLQKIRLINVTILYAPTKVIQRNHLITTKSVIKRPKVWIEEEQLVDKKPNEKEIQNYRIDINPKFDQITDDVEIKLNKMKLKLYQENKKLQEMIDEQRFINIVKNVLEKESRGGQHMEFNENDLRRAEGEKWYTMMMNADSDFEFYYKPKDVPTVCDEDKNELLQRNAIIGNPTLMHLLKHVNTYELNILLDSIKSMIDRAINTAVHSKGNELFLEPPAKIDYSKPLGDDIDKLPGSLQDLLTDEVCTLSNEGFNLFRATLKHILGTISDSKVEATTTLSGDVLLIVSITKSLLNMKALSEEEVTSRKESLLEDINILADNMIKLHERSQSDPIGIRSKKMTPPNRHKSSML